ncbi:MAG: hypothetical protein ACLTF6_06630 [Clostridium sp.]
MDGEEVTTLKVDGQEISVRAEYPEDQYQTRAAAGAISCYHDSRPAVTVALSDVAEMLL